MPTFWQALRFASRIMLSPISLAMHAVSLVSALIIRDCSFENFNGALFLRKSTTAVQLLRVNFAKNHAVGGAAVSIDSALTSDVRLYFRPEPCG